MDKMENIIKILAEKNYTIATAESCTGGLLASTIVNINGASKVFNEGYITYSNEAKERILGVNKDTIEKFGVVSEEVCKEMALKTQKIANANVAVSISGIAGPTGDTPNKPVGMVCFGFAIDNEIYTCTQYFGNIGRLEVRNKSVEFVIDFLLEKINK